MFASKLIYNRDNWNSVLFKF